MTIVGVVPEMNYRGLPRNPTPDPDLYLPTTGQPVQSLVVRTLADPDAVSGPIRDAIRRGQPGIVVYGVNPLESLVAAQTAASRFTTWTLGLFASAALILSVIGIYGIMSYLVTQRMREFGIRLALGASRGRIVSEVLTRGAWLIGVGLIIGVAGAFAAVQLLDTLLFEVSVTDASSVVAVAALIVVALVASAIPAFRATRADPLVALRAD
jgi:predicted lysophospholipase L1 biosynthesis ABC-type transport system permease subunit